jgi:hypothetical protein
MEIPTQIWNRMEDALAHELDEGRATSSLRKSWVSGEHRRELRECLVQGARALYLALKRAEQLQSFY